MAYAIVKIGGKQIKVSEGDTFKIERQSDVKVEVLAYSDGEKFLLGTPVLDNVKVKVSSEGEEKGKKVRVARFKSKSRYEKVNGHRQPLTVVKIDKITLGHEKAEKAESETEVKKKKVSKEE